MSFIDDLKSADIVLSYESSFASWVIRKATKSRWSHVGICDGKGNFYSAVPFKGVCLRPIDSMDRKAICRVKDLNDSQRDVVISLCEMNIGKSYDFVQVFLVGWRILIGKTEKYSGDLAPNKYECSEFVAEMFDKVGVKFGRIIDNAMPETIWSSPLVEQL